MGEGDYIVRTTHFASVSQGDTLLRPNPDRICVLFTGQTGLASISVRPVGTVGDVVNITLPTATLASFDYRTYGPLPALGWQAGSGTAGAALDVLEVIRLPKG